MKLFLSANQGEKRHSAATKGIQLKILSLPKAWRYLR